MGINLANLPVEILCAICADFCTHCQEVHVARPRPHYIYTDCQQIRLRRSTLAALSRTSRTLEKIAVPYLYHFLFHQRDSIFPQTEDKGESLPYLIRTIVTR